MVVLGLNCQGSVTSLGLFLGSSLLVRKEAAVDKSEVSVYPEQISSPKCQAVLVWLSGKERHLLPGGLGGLCANIHMAQVWQSLPGKMAGPKQKCVCVCGG